MLTTDAPDQFLGRTGPTHRRAPDRQLVKLTAFESARLVVLIRDSGFQQGHIDRPSDAQHAAAMRAVRSRCHFGVNQGQDPRDPGTKRK